MKKLLPIITLFFTFAASARTVDLQADCNAQVNTDMDSSPVFQCAVDILLASKGGTIIVPEGTLTVRTMVNFATNSGISIRLQGNKGSIIQVDGNQSDLIFYGSGNQIEVDGIIFTGNSQDYYDCGYLFFVHFANQFTVRNSSFFGVRCRESIISTTNQDAVIDNVAFLGSAGERAVVLMQDISGNGVRGLTVSNTNFIDYGTFDDQYYSKVGTRTWIEAWNDTVPALPGNGQRKVKIENVRFDEGAAFHIRVRNVMFVDISGINANINNTDGTGSIYLENVQSATIRQSWFGYAVNPRAAITSVNSNYRTDDIVLTQGVVLDAGRSANCSDCDR